MSAVGIAQPVEELAGGGKAGWQNGTTSWVEPRISSDELGRPCPTPNPTSSERAIISLSAVSFLPNHADTARGKKYFKSHTSFSILGMFQNLMTTMLLTGAMVLESGPVTCHRTSRLSIVRICCPML